MSSFRDPRSPASRRQRSRMPGGPIRRGPSYIRDLGAGGRVGDEARPQRQSERATILPKSRRSDIPSDPATNDRYNPTENKQGLPGRLSGAFYGRLPFNEGKQEQSPRSETLKENDRELIKENKALRRAVRSLERTDELMVSDFHHMRNMLAKMEWKYAPHSQFPESSQRLGDSYSEPRDDGRVEDNMRRKIAEYEDRILQLKAENTRLLQKSSEQENRLRAQTTEFARELEEIRSKQLIKTPSTCDSEVQGEWKALDFEVRQFVSNYLRDPLSLSTVRRLEQLEIFKWLPEMSKTLRSPFVCNIVLQSWVWHFLCFRIFDAHSVFWAGDIGKGFSVLSQQIRDHISNVDGPPTTQAPALSQLHNWRVRSTHLISQLDTHDRNTSTKQTAYTMSSCLGPVMRLIGPQDPMHENLRQDALRIVHKAAKLDRIFRLSRAYYHVFITRLKLPFVEPQSFGFQFDPETMELNSDISLSDQGKAGSVVDLAVSPGILKVGNSDGANYGSERVLAKLQVLCDLQGILERFERFRVDGETKTAKKNLRKQSRMRLRKTMMIVSTCFESTAEHAK